jgi:hypothetical protein
MNARITVEQIESARYALESVTVRYLHQHGWERTCEGTGNYWLWKKGALLVQQDLALQMAIYEDQTAEEPRK